MKSTSARNAEDQPEAEGDDDEQISVVRDDHLVEHELERDRRRDDQRPRGTATSPRSASRGAERSVGMPHKIENPDPRPLGLALEAVARPRLHRDPGEVPRDLLERHRAPADAGSWIVTLRLPTPAQHDEVIVVPVQDAWQAQPPEIAHLRPQRARGELQLVREPHDVVQRHALERDVVMLTQ